MGKKFGRTQKIIVGMYVSTFVVSITLVGFHLLTGEAWANLALELAKWAGLTIAGGGAIIKGAAAIRAPGDSSGAPPSGV